MKKLSVAQLKEIISEETRNSRETNEGFWDKDSKSLDPTLGLTTKSHARVQADKAKAQEHERLRSKYGKMGLASQSLADAIGGMLYWLSLVNEPSKVTAWVKFFDVLGEDVIGHLDVPDINQLTSWLSRFDTSREQEVEDLDEKTAGDFNDIYELAKSVRRSS